MITAAEEKLLKERNQYRNRPYDMQQYNIAAKADMEIIQLYEKHQKILQCYIEKIFDVPMEKLLEQTLKQKQQWVNR